MSRRERLPPKGRWRAIALSVLLHTGIVAAAVYGWFSWKHRPQEPTTLAIAATVVDERTLKNLPSAPAPAPPPEPEPQPEEQGPPKPDPAEVERKQEEERLAQEKLEQQKKEAEQKEQQRLDAEKKEAEKKELEKKEQQRVEAEKQAAAEKAAAEKLAAEKKAAEKKKADDAAAAKKAAAEKARLASEAELRRTLEAEERGNALRNSDQANRWHAAIVAKIQRAWIRPPSARPGVTCIVSVQQIPGGEVTAVRVASCSIEDAALRQSVENAVYSASPLPPPPDPALFERNLELTFAPQ